MDTEESDSSGSTELSILSEALIPLIRIPLSFDEYSPNFYFFESQENIIRERSIDTYIRDKYKKKDELRIALPILKYPEKTTDDYYYCTICLNPITKQEQYYKLGCNHYFHDLCIEEAVKFQHLECPLCRTRIPYCVEEKDEDDSSSSSLIYLSLNN